MTQENRILSTREKALDLNLKSHIYGAFSEIGAGQEVANHFFKAGASSGSVAKTMSAYDMAISDSIYGKTDRYVSEERLMDMLRVEFDQLKVNLDHRSENSNFFVLANTIETLNYHKTNQGQGWMGLRFQLNPNAPTNDCVIHMLLHDNDPLLQQQVIGILGVNLMHACYHFQDPENFVTALLENLSSDRVEINMLEIIGPDFAHIDNRLLSLLLVKNNLTKIAVFNPNGEILQPTTALYKKDLLILRGRFKPPTNVNIDMFNNAFEQFKKEPSVKEGKTLQLAELTLQNLRAEKEGEIDSQDFLNRADLLCSLGYTVVVSNFSAHYQLADFLHRYVKKRTLAIIIGVQNLIEIFDENYYKDLPGGILEAFSKLFRNNTLLYIYPCLEEGENLKTCENVVVPKQLHQLFLHLFENGKIKDIQLFNPEYLHIKSEELLLMIRSGEKEWENMVPSELVPIINKKDLFN